MAYSALVASTPSDAVAAYRDGSSELAASGVIRVSHLLSYWVQVQPLGWVLGECIDGGEILADRLWHPFRLPLLHRPQEVVRLSCDLNAAWQQVVSEHFSAEDDDFFQPQITGLLNLFQHAAETGESVVSFLDRPADNERARRVEIPNFQRFAVSGANKKQS